MGESGPSELTVRYERLRRFAAVVGPQDVEPDDLVQEAFVRVLRRGIDQISDLDAYLRRAILNLASNERRSWLRREKAFRRHGVAPDAESVTFVDVGDLFALPADLRAVLWLAEVEGWDYRQIGELVGCSEGAARMRAAKARMTLRSKLSEEGS